MRWKAYTPPPPKAKNGDATSRKAYRARKRYDPARTRAVLATPTETQASDPAAAALATQNPGAVVPEPANRPVIALVGDSLAEALSLGMEADASFKAQYLLRAKTSGSSGLVRDDYFDWPKALAGLLLEQPHPAGVVVMLGVNDRQILRQSGESLEPLSEPWREAYKKRVDAVISATKAAKVPLIWVGLPVMRAPRLSTELAAINQIIRDRVNASGETFVETFDGFADQSGNFTATGPDVMGDTVRLRGPDGIHFTPAGQRKLAFFVEKPLKKRLELLQQPLAPAIPNPYGSSAQTPAPKTTALPAQTIPARIRADIGAVKTLSTPPSAPSLLGQSPAPHQDPETEALFGRGIAPAPRAGRADDFRWK